MNTTTNRPINDAVPYAVIYHNTNLQKTFHAPIYIMHVILSENDDI